MLDHSALRALEASPGGEMWVLMEDGSCVSRPAKPRFFSRRAATVGAEVVDDKPKASLGETLVFLIPAFIAGLLLVGTLGMVGKKDIV